jgi:hypothetical protein
MNYLRIGLINIKAKDSSHLRRIIFNEYMKTLYFSSFLKPILLNRLFLPFQLLAFFIPLFRLLHFQRTTHQKGKTDILYEYENERRHLNSKFGKELHSEMTYKGFPRFDHFLCILGGIKYLPRLVILYNALLKKNGFLVAARQIDFIVSYCFFDSHFSLGNAPIQLAISTESNPAIIAAALAAQKKNSLIIFTNHGHLDRDLGFFFHDKIIVDSLCLKDITTSFLLKKNTPIELTSPIPSMFPIKTMHLNQIFSIGIVSSLCCDLQKLERAISLIKQVFPMSSIEIRLHPNKIFQSKIISWYQRVNITHLKLVFPIKWHKSNLSWDFAIVGNSSAALDLLKIGIPVVGFELDNFRQDMYGFLAKGLIIEATDFSSILTEINKHYSAPEWQERANYFLNTKIS